MGSDQRVDVLSSPRRVKWLISGIFKVCSKEFLNVEMVRNALGPPMMCHSLIYYKNEEGNLYHAQ